MAAGRPIEYNEQHVEQALKYIEECQDSTEQIIAGQSDKFTTYKEKLTVRLPSIEGLALYLRIHKDTVYDWEQKYPEFSDVINTLRNLQAVRLINSGLSGEYNPNIAKALLSKHGYAEKQEIDQKTEWSGTITGMTIK